jgi:hypothetical protein
MSALRMFLAYRVYVLTAIAVVMVALYAVPLGLISEVFAAKGGEPGPPLDSGVPGEGNKYGWVKMGGPPPKPK